MVKQGRMERETFCEAPPVARSARSALPVREDAPQRAVADRGMYRAPGGPVLVPAVDAIDAHRRISVNLRQA